MARKKSNIITPEQERVLLYIKDCIQKNGYPPAVREICAEMGYTSPSSAHYHLRALEEKGYIEIMSKLSRGYMVKDKETINNYDDGLNSRIVKAGKCIAILICDDLMPSDNVIIILKNGKPILLSGLAKLSKDNRYIRMKKISEDMIAVTTQDNEVINVKL